jgi:hypothetical protein
MTTTEINKNYLQYVQEHYSDTEVMNYGQFMDTVRALKLPVQERVEFIDQFSKKDIQTFRESTYPSYDMYSHQLPNWLGMNYDYMQNMPTNYRRIKGIKDGFFEMRDSTTEDEYIVNIRVLDRYIEVKSIYHAL